jgi:hypothetical protein
MDMDPEPGDQTYVAAFAFMLRDADGTLHVERDIHHWRVPRRRG